MPMRLDRLPKFIADLTEAVLADILESSTPEELQQLVEELELRQWKSGLIDRKYRAASDWTASFAQKLKNAIPDCGYSIGLRSPLSSFATSGDFKGSLPWQSKQRNLRPPVFTTTNRMGLRHFGHRGAGVFLGILLTLNLARVLMLTVTVYCRGREVIPKRCAFRLSKTSQIVRLGNDF
jgi:hypothetical protein